jgi:hypothetical protein
MNKTTPHIRESRQPVSLGRLVTLAALLLVLLAGSARAQLSEADAEAMRKAQDPLADVRALMTDNTVQLVAGLKTYNFQLQPVYSIPTKMGFNMIARGIIPVAGAPTVATSSSQYAGNTAGTTWGVSDSMAQLFFVPQTNAGIKFGFGPQISLRTRTDDAVAGPGWGGGIGACVFGFAGSVSYGGILGQHWGRENFSRSTAQPIVFYNMAAFGGSYVGYSNTITYDWKASEGKRWTVPVGVTAGKSLILNGGYILDLNAGFYYVAIAPIKPDRQIKFGFSVLFP